MSRRTVLHDRHLAAGAKMIDFAGWDMPLHYGSQVAEHRQVREHAGVFDVSHMTVIDVAGDEAAAFLRYLLANDVARLDAPGKALYSAMLNERGGVVDDLIVYRMSDRYRLVVNCATGEKDLEWIARHAEACAVDFAERAALAILAAHGPMSIDLISELLPAHQADRIRALRSFEAVELADRLVARTGYTGEKGLELILPEGDAATVWDRLLAAGVVPVGLGARDTLRLEAGMNLYGQDMDESVSPLAANMAQTIAWQPEDRLFVGREAVTHDEELRRDGKLPQLVGLVMTERGVLREDQQVLGDAGPGVVTSGGFSPTLSCSIALARMPGGTRDARVELRGRSVPVRIVKPSFVRFGRKVFE